MNDGYDDEFSGFANGYDVDSMDERMKAGGNIPPGRYHATLDGAKKTESKAKQTPGWELTFRITAGPFKGSTVTDTIYITDNVRSRDRLALFGSRLGLLVRKPNGTGLIKADGKSDFIDCLDTPAVIEVIHEPDKNDPNKKWVRLAFGGIYDLKDPKAMTAASKPANDKQNSEAANNDRKEENKSPTPTKRRSGVESL